MGLETVRKEYSLAMNWLNMRVGVAMRVGMAMGVAMRVKESLP